MKYAWIQGHANEFKVVTMCRVLKASRSFYYQWLKRIPSLRMKENDAISQEIQDIFIKSRETYGSRRIRKALKKRGINASRRRIRKLMKVLDLKCKTKRKFKATTDSKHKLPVAENHLNRQFDVSEPNQAYVGDITYIWTREGWLYLAVVIDLFSRHVVGWSMNKNMKAKLVNDALESAVWKRKPARGLLWHSDRGSQYASESHRQLIKDHGICQSMSRKGNCWDNSVAESFFKTLKTELVYNCDFKTRDEAKQAVFEYIEVFYNRDRMHSSNDYMTPLEYEKAFELSMKKVS